MSIWTKIFAIVLAVVLVIATFMPVGVTITGDGLLSIGLSKSLGQEPSVGQEIVELRTANSKTFYVGNGTYELQTSLGAVHYLDGEEVWQTISNQLVPAVAPWAWQMTTDSYQIRVLEDFTYGQVLRFEVQGEYIAFQPMALEWTNDLDQINQISMPQSGTLSVNNTPMQLLTDVETGYEQGCIRWNNAYGIDRHFEWDPAPGMLKKLLQLDSAPPEPPDYIKTGGNPVLRLNFIFEPSLTMNIYVDDVLWNKTSKVSTFSSIEFRKEGEVLWSFSPVLYWGSSEEGEQNVGISTLRTVGNKLYISSLVPYEWLQTATYPVFIDPTLTVQPGASGEDSYINEFLSTSNFGSSIAVQAGHTDFLGVSKAMRIIIEFLIDWGVDIPDGATISSAVLSLYVATNLGTDTYYASRMLRLNWVEGQVTWVIYKTGSSWSTAGCGSNGNDYSTTGQVGITILSTGWKSWTITNQVITAQSGDINVGLRISGVKATPTNDWFQAHSSDYTDDTSLRPKLVIAYTVPCSEDISNTPSSWTVNNGTAVDTSSNHTTGLTCFNVTNNSGGAVDISIMATNMTGGGHTWVLSDDATPGDMTYGLKAGLSGGVYNITVKLNSPYNNLVEGLGDDASQEWGLKLYTPTSYDDGNNKSGVVTITAACS